MDHADHTNLLRPAITTPGGTWADLGSGTGAFTLALVDLLGDTDLIYSVDRNAGALREQQQTMQSRFPSSHVQYIPADFTQPLNLPLLDGILMANSLHFIPHDRKPALLRSLKNLLKPDGCFIVVEYNVDRGNLWVPYPFSYSTWQKLARQAGFGQTKLLTVHPSRFLSEFYSAQSW